MPVVAMVRIMRNRIKFSALCRYNFLLYSFSAPFSIEEPSFAGTQKAWNIQATENEKI